MNDELPPSGGLSLAMTVGRLEAELTHLRDDLTARMAALERQHAAHCAKMDQSLASLNDAIRKASTTAESARLSASTPQPSAPSKPVPVVKLPPLPARAKRNQDYFAALEAWAKATNKPMPPKPGPLQSAAAYDADIAAWLSRIGVRVTNGASG